MLGNVLEKMHQGEVLSQHDVSAALRDYNHLLSKMADLEQKTKLTKVIENTIIHKFVEEIDSNYHISSIR